MSILFPPYLPPKQESIIYTKEGYIYFSPSILNSIEEVGHIQVSINRQDNNENALDSGKLVVATGEYYVVDAGTGRPAQPPQLTTTPTSIKAYTGQFPSGYMFVPAEDIYYDDERLMYCFLLPANLLDPNIVYKIQMRFGKQVIYTENYVDYFPVGGTSEKGWWKDPEYMINFSEWSTVSILRTLKSFRVYLQDLSEEVNNVLDTSVYTFIGRNNLSEINPEETINYTRFDLIQNGKVIETSGNVRHSSSQKQHDLYTFRKVLEQGVPYKVSYTLNTTSGYTEEVEYAIQTSFAPLPPSYTIEVDENRWGMSQGQLDVFNSGVSLIIKDRSYADLPQAQQQLRPNTYIIRRASSRSNFEDWEEIAEVRASMHSEELYRKVFDTFVESGVTYRYAVQSKMLNTARGLVSEYVETSIEYPQSWLICQNNLQLQISYNMDISSYQTVIKETMIETLGSKYPFFVRNGDIRYRQFSLGGFVTSEMDAEKKLVNEHENEYVKERDFRDIVESLLLDGRPKVIKTETEGLILVHLSNITLAPERALGRKIWSFSCQVTEVGEFNIENLVKYNLLNLNPAGAGTDIRMPAIVGFINKEKETITPNTAIAGVY